MLERDAVKQFWPPLVREVEQTREYPGYRYTFFQTFAELDTYFTELIGPDWMKEPWAEFWIGQHNVTRAQFRRELAARRGEQNGFDSYSKMDDETFLALVAQARTDGVKISKRSLCRVFREYGYNTSYNTVWRLMTKHGLIAKRRGDNATDR